jgi:cardiolipin synthase
MIVGAIILSWLLNHPVVIRPLMVSKLNTAVQIVFAAIALGGTGFGLTFGGWFVVAGWVTGGLTLLSAAAYLAQWMQHMALPEDRT